jgi:putative ABC transport system substrate-binding protein
MNKREFITLLGGAAAAWPLTARAQQRPMPVVGFLNAGSAAVFSELAATFRQGLDEAGYVEGRNVIIEYRWAEGRYDRLPALVADLLNRRVAVIASTGGPPVVEAAAAATTTVPIVFVSSDIILKTGLITSLNRPSRNLTGVVMSTSALLSKCLQFLDELVPKDATIGILVNPNVSNTDEDKENIQTAARQIGRQIFILTAGKEAEIDTARLSRLTLEIISREDLWEAVLDGWITVKPSTASNDCLGREEPGRRLTRTRDKQANTLRPRAA